ncbi:MAG: hypothetical protein LBB08_01960, partial [Rickettsiales bacterium]|nr:hypothetical protein [Rickettsiales bacterium]
MKKSLSISAVLAFASQLGFAAQQTYSGTQSASDVFATLEAQTYPGNKCIPFSLEESGWRLRGTAGSGLQKGADIPEFFIVDDPAEIERKFSYPMQNSNPRIYMCGTAITVNMASNLDITYNGYYLGGVGNSSNGNNGLFTLKDGTMVLMDRTKTKYFLTYNYDTKALNRNLTESDIAAIKNQLQQSDPGPGVASAAPIADPALIGEAKSACSDIPGQIQKIKIAAGISVGAGIAGTLAGGAAAASGFIKESKMPALRITMLGTASDTQEITIADSVAETITAKVSINQGDDAAKVAGAVAGAVNAKTDLPFTATADQNSITITAKAKNFAFDADYVGKLIGMLPKGIGGEAQFSDKDG